jgi:hypothetical protein
MNLEFRPVKEGRTVADWVKVLKGKSGVYIIRERGFMGAILYVGEWTTSISGESMAANRALQFGVLTLKKRRGSRMQQRGQRARLKSSGGFHPSPKKRAA